MADEPAEHHDKHVANMRKALLLVEEAIDLLDLEGAPADIAAHIDMGRHRLEAYLRLDD